MDLLIAFALFMAIMVFSLVGGVTLLLPMGAALVLFSLVALRRGCGLKRLAGYALKGAWESMVVVVILILIGCLTSLWRQSGTIAYFTYYGTRLIPPRVFILAAFLLTSLMSYALGTCFGVVSTMGVILITIARASGLPLALVGGAIMSGLYFGDRGSPAASSASLVANETRTDVTKNFRKMLKSSALPMLICAAFYALISLLNRSGSVDTSLLAAFEQEFRLSPWCLLPTVLLLALAFAGLKIRWVMLIDIVASAALTVLLQGRPIMDVLRMMVVGFAPESAALSGVLSGGGVKSMLEIALLLSVSSACTGIFGGTHMLASVEGLFARLSARAGRFPAMIVAGILSCAVFCNQTIGIIMCRQCMGANYGDSPGERDAMMMDIENSVVTLAGLVPWCIASSVPIGMMGCGLGALPFALYLYLLPLCWYLKLRRGARQARAARA